MDCPVNLSKMPGVKKTGALMSMLPSVRELRDAFLSDLGLPTHSLGAMNLNVRFEDGNTQAEKEIEKDASQEKDTVTRPIPLCAGGMFVVRVGPETLLLLIFWDENHIMHCMYNEGG